ARGGPPPRRAGGPPSSRGAGATAALTHATGWLVGDAKARWTVERPAPPPSLRSTGRARPGSIACWAAGPPGGHRPGSGASRSRHLASEYERQPGIRRAPAGSSTAAQRYAPRPVTV